MYKMERKICGESTNTKAQVDWRENKVNNLDMPPDAMHVYSEVNPLGLNRPYNLKGIGQQPKLKWIEMHGIRPDLQEIRYKKTKNDVFN